MISLLVVFTRQKFALSYTVVHPAKSFFGATILRRMPSEKNWIIGGATMVWWKNLNFKHLEGSGAQARAPGSKKFMGLIFIVDRYNPIAWKKSGLVRRTAFRRFLIKWLFYFDDIFCHVISMKSASFYAVKYFAFFCGISHPVVRFNMPSYMWQWKLNREINAGLRSICAYMCGSVGMCV